MKEFRKRNAIWECLRGSDAHPSAEMVYLQLKPAYPDLSLGTVYRNLALFRRQGRIASLGSVNGVERFDWNTAPHAHFLCRRCGRIQDLPGLDPPEALGQEAARRTGGQVEACRLSFVGLCRACREGGEPE